MRKERQHTLAQCIVERLVPGLMAIYTDLRLPTLSELFEVCLDAFTIRSQGRSLCTIHRQNTRAKEVDLSVESVPSQAEELFLYVGWIWDSSRGFRSRNIEHEAAARLVYAGLTEKVHYICQVESLPGNEAG